MRNNYKVLGIMLALLPSLLLAQQQDPPIVQFINGLRAEFLGAVPYLITIVGTVFVFTWLLRWVMSKVKAASR